MSAFLGCESGNGDETATQDEGLRITSFFVTPSAINIAVTSTMTVKVGYASPVAITSVGLRFISPDGTAEEAMVPVTSAPAGNGTIEIPGIELTPEQQGEVSVQTWLVGADGSESAVSTTSFEVRNSAGDGLACEAMNCGEAEFCYDLDSIACDYLDERNASIPECAGIGDVTKGHCVASIVDVEAPDTDAMCDFVQFWHNPTRLPIDCRCGPNKVKFDECKRPYGLPSSVQWGEGPRFLDIEGFTNLRQGALVGREWFLPMQWNNSQNQDQTMIFAVNIDTGDRRHVSGTVVDPKEGLITVGDGPDFLEVHHVVLGPDGMIYASGGEETLSEPRVWKVDPTTGDRELVYDATSEDVTLCPNGNLSAGRTTLQMAGDVFAMDADGNFYFTGASPSLPGVVVAKIDRQTLECSYLTAVMKGGSLNEFQDHIGEGYDQLQFRLKAISIHENTLYGTSDTKLISVDLETGRRTLVSNAKLSGGVGEGPVAAEGMGDFWTQYDPIHDVIWSAGAEGANLLIAIDPETGDRMPWPCWHPTLGIQTACLGNTFFSPGVFGDGGFIVDPEPPHDVFYAHDGEAIVRYDVRGGNANIISR